jgi:hypothetical protein
VGQLGQTKKRNWARVAITPSTSGKTNITP